MPRPTPKKKKLDPDAMERVETSDWVGDRRRRERQSSTEYAAAGTLLAKFKKKGGKAGR